MRRALWAAALPAILAVALALRLHGIGEPIMDHPGWRQGDTATIARNFALRRFDVMYPQTSYNGPPPNYVELELQIVPFLAAAAYKVAGVHVVIGRLFAVAFSLATVALLACFARWLFEDALAGLVAAFFYAVFPGSVYYGRTFMPDTAMVFFLTLALYAAARLLATRASPRPAAIAWTAAALTAAYLAKPVAMLAIVPLGCLLVARRRAGQSVALLAPILLFVPIAIYWLYDRRIASYAEWHWASGISELHVLPALRAAFSSTAGFVAKCVQFRIALGMLRATMLGGVCFLLTVASFVALPWVPARSRSLLWGWLAGGLLYAFVVLTVERVDYYMLPLLPLCALTIGAMLAYFVRAVRGVDAAPTARYALLALVPAVALVALVTSREPVAAYYQYNRVAYQNALLLDRALPPDALLVIGHYGPDLQYYMDRFGWEEDPLLWTPFDEQSAIKKGARYFIAVEEPRLNHSLELCAWLARFPMRTVGTWTVYETDPARVLPGAERFWRAFRDAERAGRGRAFLDSRHVCPVHLHSSSNV